MSVEREKVMKEFNQKEGELFLKLDKSRKALIKEALGDNLNNVFRDVEIQDRIGGLAIIIHWGQVYNDKNSARIWLKDLNRKAVDAVVLRATAHKEQETKSQIKQLEENLARLKGEALVD